MGERNMGNELKDTPKKAGVVEFNWDKRDDSGLPQIAGLRDALGKRGSRDIKLSDAQLIVDDLKLEDGIYTIKNKMGEAYLVIKDGKVSSQVFFPPDYDIGYLQRGNRGLDYKGAINVG